MKKIKAFFGSTLGALLIAIVAGILSEWIRSNWKIWKAQLLSMFSKKDDV